jgi:hypothetical protein
MLQGISTESATENKPPRPQGRGKGEKVRQELTARPVMAGARKTPSGARPNRKPRSGPLRVPSRGTGFGYWLLRQMILSPDSVGADKIRLTALLKSSPPTRRRRGWHCFEGKVLKRTPLPAGRGEGILTTPDERQTIPAPAGPLPPARPALQTNAWPAAQFPFSFRPAIAPAPAGSVQ